MAAVLYARGFSQEHVERQLEVLREAAGPAGCGEVKGAFSDTCSPKRMLRPGLVAALASIGKGDVLVATKICRLAVCWTGLMDLKRLVNDAGADIVTLDRCLGAGVINELIFSVVDGLVRSGLLKPGEMAPEVSEPLDGGGGSERRHHQPPSPGCEG